MSTQDPDDFEFSPTGASPDKMTFPAGYSYIMMNMANRDLKQRMRNLVDAQIEIKEGASSLLASVAASLSLLLAFAAF